MFPTESIHSTELPKQLYLPENFYKHIEALKRKEAQPSERVVNDVQINPFLFKTIGTQISLTRSANSPFKPVKRAPKSFGLTLHESTPHSLSTANSAEHTHKGDSHENSHACSDSLSQICRSDSLKSNDVCLN